MSKFDADDRCYVHAAIDWIMAGGNGPPQRETGWLGARLMRYRRIDEGRVPVSRQYEVDEEDVYLRS